METESSTIKPKTISTPSLTPEQQRVDRLVWIIDQLVMCAAAKGQVFTPERLRINAEDLIDIDKETLAVAFGKARRELDYVPGVAELRRLALADDATILDAEMRRAWEAVTMFADKWCRWNDDRDRAYVEEGAPQLPQRLLDVVRRTGHWTAYLGISPDNFPFQQKRFFEEYRAWTAVETITDLPRLLVMPERKALSAPEAQPSRFEHYFWGSPSANTGNDTAPIKRVEASPTREELQARAAAQIAQVEAWKRNRGLA